LRLAIIVNFAISGDENEFLSGILKARAISDEDIETSREDEFPPFAKDGATNKL